MNVQIPSAGDLTFVIPGAIAALPNLSLAERIALAHLMFHPTTIRERAEAGTLKANTPGLLELAAPDDTRGTSLGLD
jgi:hypothetical protein